MTERFEIRSDQRIACVGKTGSGKSTLAKSLIWGPLDRVIFHDWKAQEFEKLNAPVLTDLGQVHEALFCENEEERLYKFVYVPEAGEHGLEAWDELCRLAYEAGDIHLLGDEVKGIYQEGGNVRPITDHHEKILTRGRSRGVGTTTLSQRPKKIPMETMSESEHLFAFRLNLEDDRKRVSEIVGKRAEDTADLRDYRYLYYNLSMDEPIVCEPVQI